MERSDIDILAGRTVALKAGEETIEIKEPPVEVYFKAFSLITKSIDKVNKLSPKLGKKLGGGQKVLLEDIVPLLPIRDLLFELLALFTPNKEIAWFRERLSLVGLVAIMNAVIEVVDLKGVMELFFEMSEKVGDVFSAMELSGTKLKELSDS